MFTFADFSIGGYSGQEIAILVGAVAVAAILVAWLFKKDDEIEERRKLASQAAGMARQYHDKSVAEFMECYASGDYSGLVKLIVSTMRDIFAQGYVKWRAPTIIAVLPELLKLDEYDTPIRKVINEAIRSGNLTLDEVTKDAIANQLSGKLQDIDVKAAS